MSATTILWRAINVSTLVHAFRGSKDRVAICGARNPGRVGWTLTEFDARRCRKCERALAAEGTVG